MSKRKKADAATVEGLAEWSEGMSRHTLELAREADTNQRRRALTFRAKQHARVATIMRLIMKEADSLGLNGMDVQK